MKQAFKFCVAAMLVLDLVACTASSQSAKGVDCNYTAGKQLRDMPLACQGSR